MTSDNSLCIVIGTSRFSLIETIPCDSFVSGHRFWTPIVFTIYKNGRRVNKKKKISFDAEPFRARFARQFIERARRSALILNFGYPRSFDEKTGKHRDSRRGTRRWSATPFCKNTIIKIQKKIPKTAITQYESLMKRERMKELHTHVIRIHFHRYFNVIYVRSKIKFNPISIWIKAYIMHTGRRRKAFSSRYCFLP